MNKTYTVPIILVISLFFLGCISYRLLHVLNQRFLETLNFTRQQFSLELDACFLIALPSVFSFKKFVIEKGVQIKPEL